ncbi:hypothetical protein C8J56DRAFT_36511 [Mycena floridula]|nr:hypothetical protein C8J56DRAFT_36511 [Mycena floridula]
MMRGGCCFQGACSSLTAIIRRHQAAPFSVPAYCAELADDRDVCCGRCRCCRGLLPLYPHHPFSFFVLLCIPGMFLLLLVHWMFLSFVSGFAILVPEAITATVPTDITWTRTDSDPPDWSLNITDRDTSITIYSDLHASQPSGILTLTLHHEGQYVLQAVDPSDTSAVFLTSEAFSVVPMSVSLSFQNVLFIDDIL